MRSFEEDVQVCVDVEEEQVQRPLFDNHWWPADSRSYPWRRFHLSCTFPVSPRNRVQDGRSAVVLILSVLAMIGLVFLFLPRPHSSPTVPTKSRGIQTSKPFIIAHRGYSGILPEETVEAYKAAEKYGADFIECDVVATKEAELVCFHDAFVDDTTTDISQHPEFANRRVRRMFEGSERTAFWVSDFTLAELRTLCVRQRFSTDRPTADDCKFQIPTFEEYIQAALSASRVVGIYPEIKSPVFVNAHVQFSNNKTFEEAFVNVLKKYGYGGAYKSHNWMARPIFIQSFAPTSLVKASALTDSPLVLLIDSFDKLTQDTMEDWYQVTSSSYLRKLQRDCRGSLAGIGPWKDTILVPDVTSNTFPKSVNATFPVSGTKTFPNPNDLVLRAHALGLQVHPYTFRNEVRFLKWEYHSDPMNEYWRWNLEPSLRVDGYFSDFCETVYQFEEFYQPLYKGPLQ